MTSYYRPGGGHMIMKLSEAGFDCENAITASLFFEWTTECKPSMMLASFPGLHLRFCRLQYGAKQSCGVEPWNEASVMQ